VLFKGSTRLKQKRLTLVIVSYVKKYAPATPSTEGSALRKAFSQKYPIPEDITECLVWVGLLFLLILPPVT
jgi:hypothetical protein